jgi:hypothetical protein
MSQTLDEALIDGLGDKYEHDRRCSRRLLQRFHAGAANAQDHVWRLAQQLPAEALRHLEADNAPPIVNLEVPADNPTQLLQILSDHCNTGLHDWIIGLALFQPADASHPIWLLRESSERPTGRRTGN